MLEKLIDKLNSLSPMSDSLTNEIRTHGKISMYKPGDFVLRDGEICNRVCLIVEGLTRSFYINDGTDITSRFMEEGFIVTSWPSFYTQKPGNEFIEAIENTTIASLDYKTIQKLYRDFPEFNIIGRKQVEYAFYLAEQRTQLLRKHTAEEKYRSFLADHPGLLQRVSLKHIATYLGMSEETFSRIRSKFHRNN